MERIEVYKFTTENAAVARKTLTLLKSGFHLKTEVVITRGRHLKKNNSYMIKVVPSPIVTELLLVLGIMRNDNLNVSSDSGLLRKACCRRAYLRGAFLGGGSVNSEKIDRCYSYLSHDELCLTNSYLIKAIW